MAAHNDKHDHGRGHSHGHGHEHDQGFKAMLRYAKVARRMWTSEINDAVVARLAPKPGETVADIGAGVGAGTMTAAAAGAKVIAVEPTGYMRNILGWRAKASSRRSQISIVDGAAEATGLPDGAADGVWAVNTMHHWGNIEAGVAEVARIVAPGGRVLLVDEDFEDPTHPDHERIMAKRAEHDHHFHTVDPAAISEQLQRAGFTVAHAGNDKLIGRPVLLVEATRPS